MILNNSLIQSEHLLSPTLALTFFANLLSAWSSNLLIPSKYADGIMTTEIVLKTACMPSFKYFLTKTGIPVCFIFASANCKIQTTCSIRSLSVFCKTSTQLHKELILPQYAHGYSEISQENNKYYAQNSILAE